MFPYMATLEFPNSATLPDSGLNSRLGVGRGTVTKSRQGADRIPILHPAMLLHVSRGLTLEKFQVDGTTAVQQMTSGAHPQVSRLVRPDGWSESVERRFYRYTYLTSAYYESLTTRHRISYHPKSHCLCRYFGFQASQHWYTDSVLSDLPYFAHRAVRPEYASKGHR